MTTGQGLSAIGWFLAIVVLIPLLLWMFKRSPMGRGLAQGPMRQTGALALTPQARVVTVEIGQGDERRWLVLGVTAANVNLLKHQIQDATVELVVELAKAPATVEQLLSFKPGDFIELDLDPMVQAKVDGVPVLDCHYGTSNGRYSIKVDQLLSSSELSWIGANNVS